VAKRIVVLVSGSGTNLQAIIDKVKKGDIKNAEICAVISSKEGAYALRRANAAGISSYVVEKRNFKSERERDIALMGLIDSLNVDLIVLAGYLSILSEELCEKYENRIINVHPALIPSFCGDGYYGLKVHEKALEYGVKITGATVHFVNKDTDAGPIIMQKAVEVKDGDTAETLQKRVMEEAEWQIMPKAVSLFCEDRLKVCGRQVIILEKGDER